MLPLVILGVVSVIGGLSGLRLPETLHHRLPQTVEEGELFGKDWTCADCMRCVPIKYEPPITRSLSSDRVSNILSLFQTVVSRGLLRGPVSQRDGGDARGARATGRHAPKAARGTTEAEQCERASAGTPVQRDGHSARLRRLYQDDLLVLDIEASSVFQIKPRQ